MSDETEREREREMNTQDEKFTKKSLKAVKCEKQVNFKDRAHKKMKPLIFFISIKKSFSNK